MHNRAGPRSFLSAIRSTRAHTHLVPREPDREKGQENNCPFEISGRPIVVNGVQNIVRNSLAGGYKRPAMALCRHGSPFLHLAYGDCCRCIGQLDTNHLCLIIRYDLANELRSFAACSWVLGFDACFTIEDDLNEACIFVLKRKLNKTISLFYIHLL